MNSEPDERHPTPGGNARRRWPHRLGRVAAHGAGPRGRCRALPRAPDTFIGPRDECARRRRGAYVGESTRRAETSPGSHPGLRGRSAKGASPRCTGRGTPQLEREVALKLKALGCPADVGRDPAMARRGATTGEGPPSQRTRHPWRRRARRPGGILDRPDWWPHAGEGAQGSGSIRGAEAALVGLDLCRALAAVHAAGLVHGDLKASNVMREGSPGGSPSTGAGRVVLMDFGASGDSSPPRSRSAKFVTPLATAPEVMRGEPASRQSDFYSLGVLLFRLVTGRRDRIQRCGRARGQDPVRNANSFARPAPGSRRSARRRRGARARCGSGSSVRERREMERALSEALSEERLSAREPSGLHAGAPDAAEPIPPRLARDAGERPSQSPSPRS